MSRMFGSLEAFARFAGQVAIVSEPELAVGVMAIAKNTQREVKKIIGDPDRLAPGLSDATVIARENHAWGYRNTSPAPGVGAENTLLWSGELRDSYEMESVGLIAGVGSEEDKALWHEVGTSKIPARMPLRRAVDEAEPENIALAIAAGKKAAGLNP